MKKTLMLIAVVALAAAGTAQAELTLTIDVTTGEMTMSNPDASGINFNGYSILSASGALDPAGWYSFKDFATDDFIGAYTKFGAGVTAMAEVSTTSNDLTELGGASAGPLFAAGDSFAMGTAFTPGSAQDIVFDYNVIGSAGDDIASGVVEYVNVPEPASMSLLGLGGLALLRRRKK